MPLSPLTNNCGSSSSSTLCLPDGSLVLVSIDVNNGVISYYSLPDGAPLTVGAGFDPTTLSACAPEIVCQPAEDSVVSLNGAKFYAQQPRLAAHSWATASGLTNTTLFDENSTVGDEIIMASYDIDVSGCAGSLKTLWLHSDIGASIHGPLTGRAQSTGMRFMFRLNGGTWQVLSQSGQHLFDLADGSVSSAQSFSGVASFPNRAPGTYTIEYMIRLVVSAPPAGFSLRVLSSTTFIHEGPWIECCDVV